MHILINIYLCAPCLTASSICFVVGQSIVKVLNHAVFDRQHVIHINRRVVHIAISLCVCMIKKMLASGYSAYGPSSYKMSRDIFAQQEVSVHASNVWTEFLSVYACMDACMDAMCV